VGKRYTIILSLAIFLAACVWSGEAASYSSLRGSRLLGGLSGGLIEALGPRIVVEAFPERQLARAMVVYVGFLAAGSALGPILAGAVAERVGNWRWFMRLLSIATFCNLSATIVMLPDTSSVANLASPAAIGDARVLPSDGKPPGEAESHIENMSALNSSGLDGTRSLKREYVDRSFSTRMVQLDWRRALLLFIRPFEVIFAPQVLVTVFVFGLTIGWSVVVSILVATTYSAPPILWNSLSVGLISLAPLTGLIIGLPIGGPLADFLSRRASDRASGRHDPVSRLPATLPGAIVSPVGCLLIGYGLRNAQSSWLEVCAGWALLSVGLTGSANVLLTYAVDCLPARAGHIGALVNLTKNCLAFGVSYASISWSTSQGTVRQFGTMAGLLWMAYILVIPVAVMSRKISKITAWLDQSVC
jgi:MFS family permease